MVACIRRMSEAEIALDDVKADIWRIAGKLQLGDVLASEAAFYLECACDAHSICCTKARPPELAAACMYVVIRQHQLPVALKGVLAAADPTVKPSQLFLKVADACQLKLPAPDYTKFVTQSLSVLTGVQPDVKKKVLQTYVKLEPWLKAVATGTPVNTAPWAAALFRQAAAMHKVDLNIDKLATLFGVSSATISSAGSQLRHLMSAAAFSSHFQALLRDCIPQDIAAHTLCCPDSGGVSAGNAAQQQCLVSSPAVDLQQHHLQPDSTPLHPAEIAAEPSAPVMAPGEPPDVRLPTAAYASGMPSDSGSEQQAQSSVLASTQPKPRAAVAEDPTCASPAASACQQAQVAGASLQPPAGLQDQDLIAAQRIQQPTAEVAAEHASQAARLAPTSSRSALLSLLAVCLVLLVTMTCLCRSPSCTVHAEPSGLPASPVEPSAALQAPPSQAQQHTAHGSLNMSHARELICSRTATPQAVAPALHADSPAQRSSPLPAQPPVPQSAAPDALRGKAADLQLQPHAAQGDKGSRPATHRGQVLHRLAGSSADTQQAVAVSTPNELTSIQTQTVGAASAAASLEFEPQNAAASAPAVVKLRQQAAQQRLVSLPAILQARGAAQQAAGQLRRAGADSATSAAQTQSQAQAQVQAVALTAPAQPVAQPQWLSAAQLPAVTPFMLQDRAVPSMPLSSAARPSGPAGHQSVHYSSQLPTATLAQSLHQLLHWIEASARRHVPHPLADTAHLPQQQQQQHHVGLNTTTTAAAQQTLPSLPVAHQLAHAQQHQQLQGQTPSALQCPRQAQGEPVSGRQGGDSPWRQLPGPLGAAIASAVATETLAFDAAAPVDGASSRARKAAARAARTGRAAGFETPSGKGQKRSRADPPSWIHAEAGSKALHTKGASAAACKDAGAGVIDLVSLPSRSDDEVYLASVPAAIATARVQSDQADIGAESAGIGPGPSKQPKLAGQDGQLHSPASSLNKLPAATEAALDLHAPDAAPTALAAAPKGTPRAADERESLHHSTAVGHVAEASATEAAEPSEERQAHSIIATDDDEDASPATSAGLACHLDWHVPFSQTQRNERDARDALLLLQADHGDTASNNQSTAVKFMTSTDNGQSTSSASVVDEADVTRPPPFTDVDGHTDAYEVEKIVDKRIIMARSQRRIWYRVRWKGYSSKDDTWQSKRSLCHAREAVEEFDNRL